MVHGVGGATGRRCIAARRPIARIAAATQQLLSKIAPRAATRVIHQDDNAIRGPHSWSGDSCPVTERQAECVHVASRGFRRLQAPLLESGCRRGNLLGRRMRLLQRDGHARLPGGDLRRIRQPARSGVPGRSTQRRVAAFVQERGNRLRSRGLRPRFSHFPRLCSTIRDRLRHGQTAWLRSLTFHVLRLPVEFRPQDRMYSARRAGRVVSSEHLLVRLYERSSVELPAAIQRRVSGCLLFRLRQLSAS
jgi:hypothetical protein